MQTSLLNIEFLFSYEAIIIGILAILIAYTSNLKSIRANFAIAKASGAFKKPIIRIKILGEIINEEQEILICYGYDSSIHKNIVFEFPFSIDNSGDKSINNVIAMFEYSLYLPIPIPDTEILFTIDPLPKTHERRKYIKNQDAQYVTYSIPEINPDMSFKIIDLCLFPKSENQFIVPCSTKDEVQGMATIDTLLSYKFKFSVLATDYISKVFNINVMVLDSTNIEALEKNVLDLIEKESIKITVNEVSRLLSKKILIIYPEYEEMETELPPEETEIVYKGRVNLKKVRIIGLDI